MKTVKLPIILFATLLAVASCKKNDFTPDAVPNQLTTAAAVDTVGWSTAAAWQTADQGSFSVKYFALDDAAITSDVADDGLVLMFKKNGTAVNALPFEEADGTQSSDEPQGLYWYHQVSEGKILVSCDVYTAKLSPTEANAFKYFVITPSKLQDLTTQGYTAEALLNLDYAAARTLLEPAN